MFTWQPLAIVNMSLKANSAIMGIVSRLGASSRTGQALQTQSSIPQTCRNTSLELQLPESVLASYNRSASSNYTSHKLGGNTIRSYMRNAHKVPGLTKAYFEKRTSIWWHKWYRLRERSCQGLSRVSVQNSKEFWARQSSELALWVHYLIQLIAQVLYHLSVLLNDGFIYEPGPLVGRHEYRDWLLRNRLQVSGLSE